MQHKLFVKITSALVALCILASFCACGTKRNEYTSFAMGSVVTATLFADDTDSAAEVWNDICTSVSAADKHISATDPASDISRINNFGTAIVDEYTVEFLQKAVLLCNTLGRKTDITLGAVTSLWGFTDGTPSVPDGDALKPALETVDLDGVFIDAENRTVTVGKGQKLDLGAFGKGEACDIMKEKLTAADIPACVSFGGNILVTGKNPSGRNGQWNIGMKNPLDGDSEVFASLSLDASNGAVCVSTSGSYEKQFTENGKRYHHILDPDTGNPVENGLVAVSAVCASGLNADALSTALFVNGLNETSLMWLKSFNAEAVFVFEDGTVYFTDGLSKNFTITDSENFKTVTYEEATK